MTFAQWLKKQEKRDDPIGDFARDTKIAVSQKGAPNNSLNSWIKFLGSYSVCDDAQRAFESAWREYQRTGEEEKGIRERAKLIFRYRDYDLDTMTDLLSFMAAEVEDAMFQCGAIPGKDYKILDIFKMAVTIYSAKICKRKP